MKIGILEFLYHHVFIYSLAYIARESGADVTIFTTEELYRLVAPLFRERVGEYRWVIKGSHESLWFFLKRVEKIANSELDLLFVNTLQGGAPYWLSYYSFRPQCRSLLVTGRAEEWFSNKYKFNLKLGVKGLLHHNTAHLLRRQILSRYDGIVVHTEAKRDYVLKCQYNRDVSVLPFSIWEGQTSPGSDTGEVHFIVAGMIADYRRDYDGLLNAFEKLWSSGRDDMTLTLLGWPEGEYGQEIIKRCRILQERGFAIRYYESYIPEETFKKQVELSSVIISPIRLDNYQYGGLTGGLVEAIRHARPGIYPLGYIVPDEFESSSLFYQDISELPQLLADKILDNRGYLEELSRNAVTNSKRYSLEKVTAYFKSAILDYYAP